MAVRPDVLGTKAVEGAVVLDGAEPEDLFGDKDSDDEDPTVTSLLESRSIVCRSVPVNSIDDAHGSLRAVDTQAMMDVNVDRSGVVMAEVRLSQKRDRDE